MTSDLYVGIDLGGTKILVLVADETGRVLGRCRVATLASEGIDPVIGRIVTATRDAAGEAGVGLDRISAAGVSAPGPIDRDDGVITDPPNLPGWHNVPLGNRLQQRLGAMTVLENDANCQGVAEHQFGAGRGYGQMLFVTVSTGIGGGVIIDDELYVGASGAAGELGHMAVQPDGPLCGAGHPGCLEAFASGTAIARMARDLVAEGKLPRTAQLADASPPLSAETVYTASQQGERGATAIIETAGKYLGMGLASMINAFNPQAVVVGGGLVNMGDTLLGPAVRSARARAFAQSFADVRIVQGQLGEQSAALGAIAIARKRTAGAAG